MSGMREYLLKASDGSGWIPVHQTRLADVFLPRGWNARPCEGWGDFRMDVDGTEVSFSGEEPGWQVTIEGEMASEKADELLETLAKQLEAASGTSAYVLLITP